MPESNDSSPFTLQKRLNWNILAQVVVLGYLIIAILGFFVIPFLAASWIKTPFLGAMVEQTLVFNSVGSSEQPSHWNPQLISGDQLVSAAGKPIKTSEELQVSLNQYQVGQSVQIGVMTTNSQVKQVDVALIQFPNSDVIAFLIVPYLIGLVYLASAIWVFIFRRQLSSGRAFVVFASSLALATAGLFDLFTTHQLTMLWSIALALAGGAIFSLAFELPTEDPLLKKAPILRIIGYLAAFLFAGFTVLQMFDLNQPNAYLTARQVEFVFTGAAMIFSLLWLSVRRFGSGTIMEREQIRFLLIGALASFTPIVVWLIGSPIWERSFPFSPYLLSPLFIFPLATGYTIQRYRLLQTDYLLNRGLLYGAMLVLVAAGYAFLVSGASVVTAGLWGSNNPIVIGVVVFLIALLFSPLRQSLQRAIDAVFFRSEHAYQERLKTFSGELTDVVDLSGIIQVLRQYVQNSLLPSQIHIFILDALSDQFVATLDENGKLTTDLRFPIASPLVRKLDQQHVPLLMPNFANLPADLANEKARISMLNAQFYIPLPGRKRLTGWLALGPRLSGEAYTSRDIGFLASLCDQASLAIERAQVVGKMESRMREMNVLTRVAQGVNVTLNLDDIYELVYAQTTQIIPAATFSISLFDRKTGVLMRMFSIADDDRLAELENQPVAQGQGLEQEVIQLRKPLLTDDYQRECQRRGLLPERTDLFAWAGVPLNAGAETIGALSLGSRNPTVVYTQDQLNLVQAIADQVAGAITKARVLDESEKRARQLSTMNDMTRQLTSTLDLELLLRRILSSAVEILNCEAGSLLLVDETTDELVFRVVAGPVADDLMNRRLPPGSGMVGKSVRTQQPVITNNVQDDPSWFQKTDQQTGFVTRAVLVVPMIVKETVIGVLEVINKKDGSAFGRDDQDLLAAFASQAAVAIENARSYTTADQELADRVEELSVMQRIDRELNTSLDVNVAMRITLEWAMRQSNASAGLVGMVVEDGLKIMTSMGYSAELVDTYAESPMPTHLFHLQEVIDSGVPRRGSNLESGLLPAAHSQVMVPIRRETTTIGLIILESTAPNACSDDTLTFLNRLGDHASVAIANAQLYAAVQAANIAKSEFVSFVSHELKNPMTSIKGYTELLAAGAVGGINDAQANFLATIRSNIERMNTLISDLNDLSKIEVGRLRLDFKLISVREVVDEVIRSTRRQVDDKKQQLSTVLPVDLPPVWADRIRFVQVMVNLVSNAHKYTEAGGKIVISAERRQNEWDPQGPPQVVHIWVEDSGIGISTDDQAKIFQKFFRSDDPKTREAPGTGLGLNITKSLVEMMGGKIWFESEFRKGTTFHITIPVSE